MHSLTDVRLVCDCFCVVFAVVLLDTAESESLNWVTYSGGDEDVVGRRGVLHTLCHKGTVLKLLGFKSAIRC